MNQLEFHYGRPQLLIKSQISKVKSVQAIHGHKLNEIVNFSAMVTNLVVFLQNAKAEPHLNNPTLVEELVNKLPIHHKEEWSKHIFMNHILNPSVNDFGSWLSTVAAYLSLTPVFDSTNADSKHSRTPKASFVIAENNEKSLNCIECGGVHKLYQCGKFRSMPINYRWTFVKEKRLCFSCLNAGHNTANCGIRRECGLNGCKKAHNRLLHETRTNETEKPKLAVGTITADERSKKTLFKFVPVTIRGPKGMCEIVAFIDEGSKVSLIDDNAAKLIGLKGAKGMISLQWIGGKTISEFSRRVIVEVAGLHNEAPIYTMNNVHTTKNLELPPQSLNLREFKQKYAMLEGQQITDYENATPKMLIGLPHVNIVRPIDILNLDEHFTVHKTKLGNIVFGSNEENNEGVVYSVNFVEEPIAEIQRQMSEYFSLENFGIKICKPVVSESDRKAQQILMATTKKIGKRYETGLLWRNEEIEYQNSYELALKRLKMVEKRMETDKDLAKWYCEKIEEYTSKTYCRTLSTDEAGIISKHTWYLPHFAVCNANKGNKRRLVFDAAAQTNGVSFNTRLTKGPEEYQPQSLVNILFKFRQGKVGVCADIKEMFHQIRICKNDQDAQRFLWRGGNCKKQPDVYVMQAMIFGSASSPCSAQFIKNLNAKEFEKTRVRAVKAIVEKHYVDDFVDSFDSIEEAIDISKAVVEIHNKAGFELRGFLSNEIAVTNQLNVQKKEVEIPSTISMCHSETTEKILGMQWCPSKDQFTFILKFTRVPSDVLKGLRRPKKCEVLSIAMSIFDPYGMAACHTITSKIIMQEIWKTNIAWEMPIPENIYIKWYEWYKSLPQLEQMRIPRCYDDNFSSPEAEIELHVFVDASEMAYSAVAYWRIIAHGHVAVSFVAGKSRTSPVKPISIPRLELQAAVLGVRLAEAIINGHEIKPRSTFYWSDSKTVINWIYSDCRKYKQFVAHRIAEILHSSEVCQWNWVPGQKNPADEATRMKTKIDVINSVWITGSNFLMKPKEFWPKLPNDVTSYEQHQEQRVKFAFTTVERVNLIKFDNFSDYYRMKRHVAQVLRAISRFKEKRKNNQMPNYITAVELNNAELKICSLVQAEVYSDEIEQLSKGKPIEKSSPIYELTPMLDELGLLRLSGRIQKAQCVSENVKRPIIMPKDHTVTSLIIKHYHEKNMHQNQVAICAAVRQKFWIPSLRQRVRSHKTKCQLCKNLSAKPVPPLMRQLPEDRLQAFVRPFTYTGLDYFGPLTVSIGRRHEKRWVALFTCLTIRAIHLEMAKDLSADAAIICIRNFVNRRGVPIRIRSDRGTNFVGASREEKATISEKIANECAKRNIEWIFNTPANPSAGGAWERMVQSVKKVLAFTLKEKAPQIETLNSLLIEAENLVNSRPLTELPLEHDADDPITPNHFLINTANFVQTPDVAPKACPRKQWQISQQLKQTFWKRWVLEYLPELTRRTKWHQLVRPLKVGDVVMVCDENEMRGEWSKGLITEVFTAADGQVRSATVKTKTGSLRRPASKLAKLDLLGESERDSVHGGEDVKI